MGLSETRRIAATSLSVSGANSESTRRMPSGPASTLIVPPWPSRVQKSGASWVVLISTLLKSGGACANEAAHESASATAVNEEVKVFIFRWS